MRNSLWAVAMFVSVALSACILLPAPTVGLMPLTIAAPEFSPWIAVLQLVFLVTGLVMRRRLVVCFVIGLVVAAWPLVKLRDVERRMAAQLAPGVAGISFLNCFGGLPDVGIQAVALPLGILYYRGSGYGPRPGIIDIYGGAWQRGSPGDDARFDAYMASEGYAVFAIDYRHAPASRFPGQLEDVRGAIAFVQNNADEYGLDPNRLVLLGRSSGGQLALLAAYDDTPAGVRAVIGFYSPSNLTAGYKEVPTPDPIQVRPVLTTYLGGAPEEMPDRYREASPLSYAGRQVPPTLLIQGGRDHIVLARFTRELHAKLVAAGNRAVLLELPWAEHAFDAVPGLGNRVSLHYVEAFLAEVLR